LRFHIFEPLATFSLSFGTARSTLNSDRLEDHLLPAISIGDPALIAGGNGVLFYGGIIAGIAASIFAWWYVNHRRKVIR
jgi:hypothetical protein